MMHLKLSGLPVAWRLHLATLAALAALAVLSGVSYVIESHRIEQARIETLRAVAASATSIVAGYAADAQAGRVGEADAKRLALTMARQSA